VSGPTYDEESYVTLASPDDTTLSDVDSTEPPTNGDVPEDVDFSYGFFEFTINNVVDSTTVTLYLPEDADEPATYYKYGPTPDDPTDHWYEFLYNGETGAEIDGNVITLYFVDGKRGDDDLTDNGVIVDQGGPGFPVSPETNNETPSGGGGGGGGCFIGSLEPVTANGPTSAFMWILMLLCSSMVTIVLMMRSID
jgi:hypothetical protein